ncbi:MAG: DNA alkylation repair protein [Prochloron sp. SP5CPC1]|nr:DNA alkylation repair protein [Candidatus Paraprochloron terpiosi SP5CPC1]
MSQLQIEKFKTRKGAIRRAEIPREVLQALNQGKIETVNLVEWLAIDMPLLLHNVLMEVDWEEQIHHLHGEALKLQDEGIIKRLKGIGEALFHALAESDNRSVVFEAFASHTSDVVRAWAAYAVATDEHLSLSERLLQMRRFAADQNMSVKECAWGAMRPYLVEDLTLSFQLLIPWVQDQDANIRRCAIEATRPRGVWCKHIPALKENPESGLSILEFVRSDSSKYVQRSVANWLNDASKSRSSWVINVCNRWAIESPTKETAGIIQHALRTIKKKGCQEG